MDWMSLLLPLGYVVVLFASLATFSYLYRRRKAVAAASLEPWFPPHLQRQVYLSLLELSSNPDRGQKVPDSILRAALLRRATEDIQRLVKIRNQKPALSQLLQRGSVGDELWQRFLIAEKEMEDELRDVVAEANALAPQQNWGQTIFQSAGECAHQEAFRAKMKELDDGRAEELEKWESRRESVRAGFMKELDGEPDPEPKTVPTPVEDKKPPSSDDDAVVVESGGPVAMSGGKETGESPQSQKTPTSGGKKKKNKK